MDMDTTLHGNSKLSRQRLMWPAGFPEKVLDHIFSFIETHKDRNSVSLVCKTWYETERLGRRKVFISNCYAVSPSIVTRRFPDLRSLEVKGKPHFADFNLIPDGWGAYFQPWIAALENANPGLEEIKLKRMVVTDECLEIIAKKFKDFKVLVMRSCEGFSTDGLAAIASGCRDLRVLDLRDCEVDDWSGDWLSHFPEDYTSLVSLNISCLNTEVNFEALEKLVARCPNLNGLRLNRLVPLEKLASLLLKAPGLEGFGTGVYSAEVCPDILSNLTEAFSGCKQLKHLCGFWDVVPEYVPAVYPTCPTLTSLNLSFASLPSSDLAKLITQCPNLQRLWVLDCIDDTGLEAVAKSCRDLQELRVFPSDPFDKETGITLTEKGLVSISEGCPKINKVLYFCRQFTNAALNIIAENSPQFIVFRLCIMEPHTPDYLTQEPLDSGFGAIVKHCKNLKRLSLSGLLTDRVFEYIGTHAKKLQMLSIAFAGNSDLGLSHVLSGCDSLMKLEIRDSPFGDKPLLEHAAKFEAMRSLWMSSCSVTFGVCKQLGLKLPRVNVEVIDESESLESGEESAIVEKVYIYRTVAGPRLDMPEFVHTMDKGIVET